MYAVDAPRYARVSLGESLRIRRILRSARRSRIGLISNYVARDDHFHAPVELTAGRGAVIRYWIRFTHAACGYAVH